MFSVWLCFTFLCRFRQFQCWNHHHSGQLLELPGINIYHPCRCIHMPCKPIIKKHAPCFGSLSTTNMLKRWWFRKEHSDDVGWTYFQGIYFLYSIYIYIYIYICVWMVDSYQQNEQTWCFTNTFLVCVSHSIHVWYYIPTFTIEINFKI